MANHNTYPEVGIDYKIKLLQNILGGHLNWPEIDLFGRVTRVLSGDGKSFEAAIYKTETEAMDVFYDDRKAKGGSVFFIDDLKHTERDFLMEANIKVVFMLNLAHLYPNITTRPDALAQTRALSICKRSSIIRDLSVQTGIAQVLDGFQTKAVQRYDIQPMHTFSISGVIRYSKENCFN